MNERSVRRGAGLVFASAIASWPRASGTTAAAIAGVALGTLLAAVVVIGNALLTQRHAPRRSLAKAARTVPVRSAVYPRTAALLGAMPLALATSAALARWLPGAPELRVVVALVVAIPMWIGAVAGVALVRRPRNAWIFCAVGTLVGLALARL